jgi:hypothetical protein
LTSNLKGIQTKYRTAVDSGRVGHGRVVLLFFKEVEQVWGGSLVSSHLDAGLESLDQRVWILEVKQCGLYWCSNQFTKFQMKMTTMLIKHH